MTNRERSALVYPQVQQAALPLRLVSKAASAVFLAASQARGYLYDTKILSSKTLPGRVISVGNIAVGGTGKTPVVIAVCEWLVAQGQRPAVLTRGYGSGIRGGDWIALLAGQRIAGNCSPRQLPDEARLESESLPSVPIIVGPARYRAAQSWLAHQNHGVAPTHWVLDDGFQHRSLKRDVDLVLVDGIDPFGNGSVLPWGLLREPPSSLRRATHVLFTGTSTSDEATLAVSSVTAGVRRYTAAQESLPLSVDLSGSVTFDVNKHAPLLLIAGIARPQRVKHALTAEKVPVSRELFPGDHVALTSDAVKAAAAGMSAVVTTAKDYWRNPHVFHELKIPVFIKKMRIALPESLLIDMR